MELPFSNLPQLLASLLTLVIILHVFLLGISYLILLERKICSWCQDRIGPNRVGKYGLLQPIADGLKFMVKEDYNPPFVDKLLFFGGPALAVVPAIVSWAVIPWGGVWHSPWGDLNIAVANVNIGVIYILAAGSLGAYGLIIGAWASNSKYSFLGGLRATAQMLSYEIPMGLILLTMILLVGSARPDEMVAQQVGYFWDFSFGDMKFGFIPSWYVFQQPLAAVLFFVCILAEANRTPFDMAEAESELVGGYHTEYSSMKFALFFLGEYMHMITGSALLIVLFFGGWHLPLVDRFIYADTIGMVSDTHGTYDRFVMGEQPIAGSLLGVMLKIGVFLAKVTVVLAVMMWIRWTLPRFRFDQLMTLAWKSLIPLSLLILMVTGIFIYFGWENYLWVGNIMMVGVAWMGSKMLPKGKAPNRRVELEGSRYCAPGMIQPAN